MYGQNLIDGSVKWINIPRFGCGDGPPWTENILVPILHWGVVSTIEQWDWRSQPDGFYGGVEVPCCGAVPACQA